MEIWMKMTLEAIWMDCKMDTPRIRVGAGSSSFGAVYKWKLGEGEN